MTAARTSSTLLRLVHRRDAVRDLLRLDPAGEAARGRNLLIWRPRSTPRLAYAAWMGNDDFDVDGVAER